MDEVNFWYVWGAVNLVTFLLFWGDKVRAREGRWRIRERTLLLFSFFGGALGAWMAMVLFRHKTKKGRFRYGIPGLVFLQVFLLGLW